MEIVFILVMVMVGLGVVLWAIRNAKPGGNGGDPSMPYLYPDNTSSSGHIHSDHCGHGHDGGADGGGDCGGGDGGGGGGSD